MIKRKRFHVLNDIVQKNNLKIIAEVGVKHGTTTFFLLNHNPDLTVLAIDKNTEKFYNHDVANQYGHRLKPMCGPSSAIADQIPDQSLDLVFIDASHSYEFVRLDIIKYRKKLKPKGWLTGHDIDYPGVYQAVNELLDDYNTADNNVWYTQI